MIQHVERIQLLLRQETNFNEVVCISNFHRDNPRRRKKGGILSRQTAGTFPLVLPRRMVEVLGRCRDPRVRFPDGWLLFVCLFVSSSSRGRFVSFIPSSLRIREYPPVSTHRTTTGMLMSMASYYSPPEDSVSIQSVVHFDRDTLIQIYNYNWDDS